MTTNIQPLQDVLKVLKTGAEFYDEAARKVGNPQYAEQFRALATVRHLAIADLETEVSVAGGTPADADWAENARAWYGKMRAEAGDEETWVAQLEEHEDRTLDAIKSAMSDAIDTSQHTVLERHLSAFRETHDRMKAIKDRLAA